MSKNPAAQALGRMAKGCKKKISEAERKARAERMAHARKYRRPTPLPAQSADEEA
jgi:hypothetical protein